MCCYYSLFSCCYLLVHRALLPVSPDREKVDDDRLGSFKSALYTYIYIERERCIYRYTYIYIYIYLLFGTALWTCDCCML